MACFNNRPKQECKHSTLFGIATADPNDRLKLFNPLYAPVLKFDAQNNGDDEKLGFGLTSADEVEEVDIGLGISHDQPLSAKS